MKATRMLLWSEINPMMAGKIAPPRIEATNKDDLSSSRKCVILIPQKFTNLLVSPVYLVDQLAVPKSSFDRTFAIGSEEHKSAGANG